MALMIESTTDTVLYTRLIAGSVAARRTGQPVLVSVSEPVADRDPLAFWAAATALTPDPSPPRRGETTPPFPSKGREVGGVRSVADRLYWQAPDGLTLAGAGSAWTFTADGPDRFAGAAAAWAKVLATAHTEAGTVADQPGAGPLLMGGFAFDPDRPATPTWTGFPAGLLILPRFLLARNSAGCLITTNVLVTPEADPATLVEHLDTERRLLTAGAMPAAGAGANASLRQVEEDVAGWKAAVAKTAIAIRAGKLDKAVLARPVEVTGAHNFDPAAVLRALGTRYNDCYLYAIERGGRCFLGATPERLVRKSGALVKTTCLAGTTRRGTTPDEDEILGSELLASGKNRAEHAVVVHMIAGAMQAVCTDLQRPNTPALLRLANVQHLYTPIVGRLREGVSLLDLVARLHPTPAVGGFPRAAALAHIRAVEGMDRGWYAAPVGWLDARGDGEFAVALRSALITGATARLFAGCGIMADSEPDAEYAETLVKLRAMLSALEAAQA